MHRKFRKHALFQNDVNLNTFSAQRYKTAASHSVQTPSFGIFEEGFGNLLLAVSTKSVDCTDLPTIKTFKFLKF